MKKWKIALFVLNGLFFMFILASCKKEQPMVQKEESIPYSLVIGAAFKEDKVSIYGIEGKNMRKIEDRKLFSDMLYDFSHNIKIYVENTGEGTELLHNKIYIEKKEKKETLDDFYSSLDLRMSERGEYIAFRNFEKDSFDSVAGVKIYDISNGKYVPFDTEVLISGNVYQWLDGDHFLYYGVIKDKKERSKIFKYSIKENKQEVFLENIEGFCTFFIPYKDKGVILLEKDAKESNLYFLDFVTKKKSFISNKIEDIYNAAVNVRQNEIELIALNKEENIEALYSFDVTEHKLNRITYDFPQKVDHSGGLAIGPEGDIYFCGEAAEENKKDIYMFLQKEKSIQLITNTPGAYKVYGGTR